MKDGKIQVVISPEGQDSTVFSTDSVYNDGRWHLRVLYLLLDFNVLYLIAAYIRVDSSFLT